MMTGLERKQMKEKEKRRSRIILCAIFLLVFVLPCVVSHYVAPDYLDWTAGLLVPGILFVGLIVFHLISQAIKEGQDARELRAHLAADPNAKAEAVRKKAIMDTAPGKMQLTARGALIILPISLVIMGVLIYFLERSPMIAVAIIIYLIFCFLSAVLWYRPSSRIELCLALVSSVFLTPFIGLPICWFFFRWI